MRRKIFSIFVCLVSSCQDDMPECPSLVAECDDLSQSACEQLCKMCSLTCGRCERTTSEPSTTTTYEPPMKPMGFMARSATFEDDETSVLSHCEKAAIANPIVKCSASGMYRSMQCLPVQAQDGADSMWDIEICYCVDVNSGEKIPLTEKAVMGDQDRPNCETVTEEDVEEMDYVEPTESYIPLQIPSKIYTSQDERPCEMELNRIVKERLDIRPPDCDTRGYFQPIQCISIRWNTRTCWCADIFTGIEQENTRKPVMGAEMNNMCGKTEQTFAEPAPVSNCLKLKSDNLIHNKQVQESGIYASFSDLKYVPTCAGNGMYDPSQCDDQKKECWCVNPTGLEIEKTRKIVGGIFKNTLKPDCQTILNPAKPDGPCFKQANLFGRQKLTCDDQGMFVRQQMQIHDGIVNKFCVNVANGNEDEEFMVNEANECVPAPTPPPTLPPYAPNQALPGFPAPTGSTNMAMNMMNMMKLMNKDSPNDASPSSNMLNMMNMMNKNSPNDDSPSSNMLNMMNMMNKNSPNNPSPASNMLTMLNMMNGNAGNVPKPSSNMPYSQMPMASSNMPSALSGESFTMPVNAPPSNNVMGGAISQQWRQLLFDKLSENVSGSNAELFKVLANRIPSTGAATGTSSLLSNPLYQQMINRDVRMAQLSQSFNPDQTGLSVDNIITPQQTLQQQMVQAMLSKMG